MTCFDEEPDHIPEPCSRCAGTGEVFVKRDRKGNIDYLSGRVINNETTQCDKCRGDGYER